MNRTAYLTTLTVVSLLLAATSYDAQQERAELTVQDVAENLYMLSNAPSVQGMGGGGNTAIFVTADGVTLVDTKISGYGPDILEHVRSVTDKPVTHIINTHTHWDHTGSNTEFSDTVTFVAHENTLTHLSSSDCDDGRGFDGGSIKNCDAFKGDNEKYLPQVTYDDRTSLHSGSDQIDLYHFGRGHTDGDTFVVFRNARTMHTGDMFQRKGLPFIDVMESNGSAIEFGATLRKAMDGISDVDTVIPGHNPVAVTWDEFVGFVGFYNDFLEQAQQAESAGRSVDEAAGSYSVPSQYSDFSAPEGAVQRGIQWIYGGY